MEGPFLHEWLIEQYCTRHTNYDSQNAHIHFHFITHFEVFLVQISILIDANSNIRNVTNQVNNGQYKQGQIYPDYLKKHIRY